MQASKQTSKQWVAERVQYFEKLEIQILYQNNNSETVGETMIWHTEIR